MKVLDVVEVLESLAPTSLAADWDNVGLLVGDLAATVDKMMLCIDATEAVIAEAVRTRAHMLMGYHPLIFKSTSKVTACETPVIYAAARGGLAVYSMHTALDAAPGGTNDVLAGVLNLVDTRPLIPTTRRGQCKIVVFAPPDDLPRVAHAAFSEGAGRIGNYYDCAFFCHGLGSFCGEPDMHPSVGEPGRHEVTEELRLEMVVPKGRVGGVCSAIRSAHSYEQPVVDVYPLEDVPEGSGMGRIGRLKRPATLPTLLGRIKRAIGVSRLQVAIARGANDSSKHPARVNTAACWAGSCGSEFRAAAAAGAQLLLTGEMRHHDALAAASAGMTVVCTGHSNSERITLSNLARRIRKRLPGFTVTVSKKDRDPFEIA